MSYDKEDNHFDYVAKNPDPKFLRSMQSMDPGPHIYTDVKISKREFNAMKLHRSSSIVGPKDAKRRRIFIISIIIMEICGAGNDFFAKTIYQILPGSDSGLVGLLNDYWATWCLTFAAFGVCSFALINGRHSFKDLTWKSLARIIIPAFMDLFVTGGRYLALVFLPAAVVSILKNGLQLFFLSIIRACRGKTFGKYQWCGLFILLIGLIIISVQDLIDANDSSNSRDVSHSIFGVALMVFVGLAGAIRNTIEEVLLKNYSFHSDFIVGMESIFSLLAVCIAGLVLLAVDEGTSWHDVVPGLYNGLSILGVLICGVLFIMSVYGKDTMQMKVTQLSSAMTRKLFQQMYPITTYVFSIILHYSYKHLYGENWDRWSYIQLIGFSIVLYGTYIYYVAPRYGLPNFIRKHFGCGDDIEVDKQYKKGLLVGANENKKKINDNIDTNSMNAYSIPSTGQYNLPFDGQGDDSDMTAYN